MATATHGSSIVFPAECFDPLASLKAVQENACTALYGVPTMFVAELELLAAGVVPGTGLEHLRTGIAAGSSIPAELMRKLHRVLNLTELTICYGMTETSPVSAMTTTDDPMEKRIDSVGKLLPHVSAKVVDPSDWSRVLPIGERGELAVSGYLVMKGYWRDEAKTREVLVPDREGKLWMHVSVCFLFFFLFFFQWVELPFAASWRNKKGWIETAIKLAADETPNRQEMKHPWIRMVTSRLLDVSKTSSSKEERTYIHWRSKTACSRIQ
jgi:acyl-CoA synthetase (AMP-forming)/AMP-acid ligase II